MLKSQGLNDMKCLMHELIPRVEALRLTSLAVLPIMFESVLQLAQSSASRPATHTPESNPAAADAWLDRPPN